mmetsp:Transcript_4571/g.11545  ORF Transcript_4571/g.11545 Transcript_4571/m.11545 type:complete len:403 (+) Transcript_4571:360-1568(+)
MGPVVCWYTMKVCGHHSLLGARARVRALLPPMVAWCMVSFLAWPGARTYVSPRAYLRWCGWCGLVTRYTDSVMDVIFSRMRGGALSMHSSLPSSFTAMPYGSYSPRSSSGGTLCGGPFTSAAGSYDTATTSMRAPGAMRSASSAAYRVRSPGSMATRAPRSHTASMAGPPPAANLSASSLKLMLNSAPTRASAAASSSFVMPNRRPSGGRGSGVPRRLNRSPSMMATLPEVCTRRTPAATHGDWSSAGLRSALVVERGMPLSAKNSLAARPDSSTPYTRWPHAASHVMSTALPHRGTNTRRECSGGEVTPSPSSAVLCRTSWWWAWGRWNPIWPTSHLSFHMPTAASCAAASASLSGGRLLAAAARAALEAAAAAAPLLYGDDDDDDDVASSAAETHLQSLE